MTEQEKIEAQVARAVKAGKGITDCPYASGTKRFLWRQAFRAAKEAI